MQMSTHAHVTTLTNNLIIVNNIFNLNYYIYYYCFDIEIDENNHINIFYDRVLGHADA